MLTLKRINKAEAEQFDKTSLADPSINSFI